MLFVVFQLKQRLFVACRASFYKKVFVPRPFEKQNSFPLTLSNIFEKDGFAFKSPDRNEYGRGFVVLLKGWKFPKIISWRTAERGAPF